jgi:hypothetical protein
MITAKSTGIVAICITLIIVIFDIVLAVDGHKGNTISEIIRYWSNKILILPFAWGVLMGHFWHPMNWYPPQPTGVAILSWVAIFVWIVAYSIGVPPIAVGMVGIVAGVILWPC